MFEAVTYFNLHVAHIHNINTHLLTVTAFRNQDNNANSNSHITKDILRQCVIKTDECK